MRSKKRVITIPHNFALLFAVENNMQKREREEERDEHPEEGWMREREGEEVRKKWAVCVLVSPLPLVFTWLLIHYTEHST